jgi:hypothetical protein
LPTFCRSIPIVYLRPGETWKGSRFPGDELDGFDSEVGSLRPVVGRIFRFFVAATYTTLSKQASIPPVTNEKMKRNGEKENRGEPKKKLPLKVTNKEKIQFLQTFPSKVILVLLIKTILQYSIQFYA